MFGSYALGGQLAPPPGPGRATTGVIQNGGVPRGLAGTVSTGWMQGWPIKYLSVGKLHLDDISLGFVSRKAGKGPLES